MTVWEIILGLVAAFLVIFGFEVLDRIDIQERMKRLKKSKWWDVVNRGKG